jgi:hypothetical protein
MQRGDRLIGSFHVNGPVGAFVYTNTASCTKSPVDLCHSVQDDGADGTGRRAKPAARALAIINLGYPIFSPWHVL